MEDNIKELKIKYEEALKSAKTKEEKDKIKHDYLEMKELLKSTNKVLKDNENFEKKFYKDLDKDLDN